MTDQIDKLFAHVDKMFESVDKMVGNLDSMTGKMDQHLAVTHSSIKLTLKNAQATAKSYEQQAQALQAIRDSLIGKEGCMVEFTVWNNTTWQGFLEFFGLWKRKRVGMIVKSPEQMTFECVVEEPDKVRHNVHVLHLTVLNPLDALARGV